MAYHGHGVYAPNEGPVDVGRIVEIIRSPVGDGAVVLLAHQAGKDAALQRVREACPDAVIQIRRYVQDWTAETPTESAHRFVEAMERCRPWTDHGTWANEQDLAAESAGTIGAAEGRLITWDEWRRIADFNHAVAVEVDRVAPWIVKHYPGMAYGHGEDWGYDDQHRPLPGFPVVDGVPRVAYELCRPGIDLCPILNHHPYVQRGAPVLDEWRGVRRIERTIALFPGKTLFVAETGQFDVRSPRAADEIVQIAYYLQGRPEVLGWCFFILDSPDPGHAMNNWSLNRAIEDAYRRMTRIARPRAWPTPPPQEPPVPDATFGVPTVVKLTEAHGPPRASTVGIFVHSTRSGTNNTLQQEYDGTVAYFMRPDGDSAHVVVGPLSVTRMVHDDDASYHAVENNRTHLGIEIAQPTIDRGYTDFQYQAAAAVARAWCDKYGIPRTRVMSQAVRGIIGHEDSEQGKRFGKSDPGPRFDWPRFIALVRGETPMPPTPTAPTAADVEKNALAPAFKASEYLFKVGTPKAVRAGHAIQSAIDAFKYAPG